MKKCKYCGEFMPEDKFKRCEISPSKLCIPKDEINDDKICPYCNAEVEGHTNKIFCTYRERIRYANIKKMVTGSVYRLDEHENKLWHKLHEGKT